MANSTQNYNSTLLEDLNNKNLDNNANNNTVEDESKNPNNNNNQPDIIKINIIPPQNEVQNTILIPTATVVETVISTPTVIQTPIIDPIPVVDVVTLVDDPNVVIVQKGKGRNELVLIYSTN